MPGDLGSTSWGVGRAVVAGAWGWGVPLTVLGDGPGAVFVGEAHFQESFEIQPCNTNWIQAWFFTVPR